MALDELVGAPRCIGKSKTSFNSGLQEGTPTKTELSGRPFERIREYDTITCRPKLGG